MHVNFELYKVFFEVAKAKSISKGALNLNISQPAVTQSIKTLEDELGGKLFIRTPKGVVLTTEGEELFKFVEEGISYFVNGTNKFKSLKNLDEGVLNIGATTTIAENVLIPYVKRFHSLYPNVIVNIINDLTENLLKNLRNGNLDIAIVAIPNYSIKDLKVQCLIELSDVFVGGKQFKDKVYSDFNEFFQEDILLQKKPSVTRNNFEEYLKINHISCKSKMEVVSHNLLIKLVESGFGIGLVTKEFVSDKLNKTLFLVKSPVNVPKRKLGYFIKKDSVPSFSTLAFMDLLNVSYKK